MSCEPAPASNSLAHPPYVINNVNVTGTPEPLGQNILSPTARELPATVFGPKKCLVQTLQECYVTDVTCDISSDSCCLAVME
jgi:hypothetical protein